MRGDLVNLNFKAFNKQRSGLMVRCLEIPTTHIPAVRENAVINQFNPVGMRNDIGALWENYIISERMKFTHYNKIYANRFFWRTHAQQEIDYIEEYNGQVFAYEFKWNAKARVRFPKKFIETYKPAVTQVITPDNYTDFISNNDDSWVI